MKQRPPDVNYFDLADSLPYEKARAEWAASLAQCFVWVATADEFVNGPPEANLLHECWVNDDLVLLIRYEHFGELFGTLLERLEIDFVLWVPLMELRGARDKGSSYRQAMMLYHNHLNGGPPDDIRWTDSVGYLWWGDEPRNGWSNTVDGTPAKWRALP